MIFCFALVFLENFSLAMIYRSRIFIFTFDELTALDKNPRVLI